MNLEDTNPIHQHIGVYEHLSSSRLLLSLPTSNKRDQGGWGGNGGFDKDDLIIGCPGRPVNLVPTTLFELAGHSKMDRRSPGVGSERHLRPTSLFLGQLKSHCSLFSTFRIPHRLLS